MSRSRKPLRRRSVATRVLLSYAILSLAFALVLGWGVIALRSSSNEADLMRSGYLPLARTLGDLVARQDTWNTQLNHITTARNPADIRIWFESMLRIGRPKKFGEARAAIARAFMMSDDASVRRVGQTLLSETSDIERFLGHDDALIVRIFDAINRGESATAESLRDDLVTRGYLGARRLSLLEQRVQEHVESLLDAARARERMALRLLVSLAVFTVLVGAAMALYARRVLRPLTAVTERAKAVAQGDLTPRTVVPAGDEIGELAATFEGMVSAIARANEQLLTHERLATIGKMAAHVTHEIRNPLSSIALNVELLEEELASDSAESRALLRAVKNEVERLTALSEQYLSVARRQQFQLQEEDVGEIIEESAEFLRRDLARAGVALTIDVDPQLPPVLADEAQLRQALINLVRNAREAMPSGGSVAVTVHGAAGGGVDITVDDQGPGIDAETRSRLFEPFFTTKHHGTGLGLAITRQIVEGHGGTIACEARPTGGTRFWIHLPGREQASLRSPSLQLDRLAGASADSAGE